MVAEPAFSATAYAGALNWTLALGAAMAEPPGSATASMAASGRIFLNSVISVGPPLGIPFPDSVSAGVWTPSMGRRGEPPFTVVNAAGSGGHLPRAAKGP